MTPAPSLTPVRLARLAVEQFVRERSTLEVPGDVSDVLLRPAAVFVCIKNKGELRGCIGTTLPRYPTLAEEIIHNAIGSCSRDHRFSPVAVKEIGDLRFSVDVLSEPERISTADELETQTYGVVVKSGKKTGVLLPRIDGIVTAGRQLEIACRKANISMDDGFELYRFVVERYENEEDGGPQVG